MSNSLDNCAICGENTDSHNMVSECMYKKLQQENEQFQNLIRKGLVNIYALNKDDNENIVYNQQRQISKLKAQLKDAEECIVKIELTARLRQQTMVKIIADKYFTKYKQKYGDEK